MPSAPDGVQQKLQQWHEAPHHELGQSGAKGFFLEVFSLWLLGLFDGWCSRSWGSWNVNGNCLTFCWYKSVKTNEVRKNPWPTLRGVDENPGIYLPNDLQILHGALFIFRRLNFLENCHVGAIPNSSSRVHLHWHIERISGCNHLMLGHWHFSLLWTTKLSGLWQEFTWNTWIIMKSWDLFKDVFFEKKKTFKQFSINFLSVLVPASNLGIHIQYNVPLAGKNFLNNCPQKK